MTDNKSESFSNWKRKLANRKPEREVRNRLLSINEVVDILGVSRMTLYRWRDSGRFPEGRKIAGSNMVRWRESTVDQWIDEGGF